MGINKGVSSEFKQNMGVVVDTNVLLYIQDGLSPFEEVDLLIGGSPKFYILEEVMREMQLLSTHGHSMEARVRVAMEYLSARRDRWILDRWKGEGADDAILSYAASKGFAVLTNDFMLKRRVKEAGVTLIFIKGKRVSSTVLS